MTPYGNLSAVESLVHLPQELFQRDWLPIWYPFDFLAIAANTTVTVTAQVDNLADFVALGGTYTATANGTPGTFVTPAAYTIGIQGPGRQNLIGSQGSNAGITHIANVLGGQGGQKNDSKFPISWFVARNGTIAMTLTNLDNTQRDVRVVLYGWSVY